MSSQTKKIAVLQGDYIGPEIMHAGLKVLEAVSQKNDFEYEIESVPFGGEAIDKTGDPLPAETLKTCQQSDAVLLSAIGGPKWDNAKKRPEAGLLEIRKELNLFSNIRPTVITKAMKPYSPIKVKDDVDFVIVRELTSGIYFGTPRNKTADEAYDTMRYTADEIRRVAKVAFDMAMRRKKHVTMVDKANVLATSKFWREIVSDVAKDYPEVTYDNSYVDAMAMKIVSEPEKFDVILTENLFGDILSDESAEITGSLGTIPSMSMGNSGPALYEPIHGSAPDIAGLGIADPISMIKSVAMMLENSFDRPDMAKQINDAIDQTIADKVMTPDLGGHNSTDVVTDEIIKTITESSETYVTNNVR
ncbi:3-isopropylmalate dehydrogenase [Companilactobacillus sp.]|jgi:3-isopropylmalate dehydrogenase|uniref:3-isopropylmalate dehydrogenase n=1 Tax=Companilactobacillus sp. TaxID=2767905 RepID=UPI0025C68561|nr:3-isopropylmalate dehydrogenase [Companilactobacillus sp.]MCH4010034.1 3-isopropylmalate dehydrogenase [Companilactobacillus sp.]MCH4052290.1 3-isopropylmalate dehydrogenase [Companilactobacillus sp.]MCH4077976.1 3-isopropylmalate dehydrogenase [Companilactobacillus sp.]MCH4126552.1 3-isopropylmalate dehydrogenase [Companilactobacillus sp.]MCH4132138.1 3-isopropylmalate dehydrogenase [Companilactobacillus sp.]